MDSPSKVLEWRQGPQTLKKIAWNPRANFTPSTKIHHRPCIDSYKSTKTDEVAKPNEKEPAVTSPETSSDSLNISENLLEDEEEYIVVTNKKHKPENEKVMKIEQVEKSEILETPESSHLVKISKTKDIDWKAVQPSRAGVIVFNRWNKDLIFSMAVNSSHGEISDFGGGVSYRRDKNALVGALREFREESHCCYPPKFDIENSWAIYDDNMMIVFVEIHHDINRTLNDFNRKKTIRSEICDLVWVNEKDFKNLIAGQSIKSENGLRNYKMYDRCIYLISNGIGVLQKLRQ